MERAELAVGDELDAGEFEAIRDRAHREAAFQHALRYLSHRPRSRLELERQLRARGYVDNAVRAAVERCASIGYVNDREFAATFARDRIRLRPRASRLLEAELRDRGVSRRAARSGVAEAMASEEVEERDLLRRAAEEGWRRLRQRDPQTARRQLGEYLRRRGFRAEEVRGAVADLLGRD